MKTKIFSIASGIASLVLFVAVTAAGTASLFGAHQPKEPDSLLK